MLGHQQRRGSGNFMFPLGINLRGINLDYCEILGKSFKDYAMIQINAFQGGCRQLYLR